MKLIIQIPCLNEEATLPLVLTSIPHKIDGIDQIIVQIIDDGSSDRTVEVAREHGVKHIVRHKQRMGLARSFHDGIHHALKLGADIVVNTDGDNQYPQERIAELVQPIINGHADIVIGDRQPHKIAHFSPFKRLMQRFGSWVVNKAAGTNVPDAASGFRAYSREALLRINIVTRFSYCMETIIQAGNKGIPITSIPITTNPKTRESRLFSSIWQHMYKSASAIIRSFIMYRPHLIFISIGSTFLALGLIPFVRYGVLYWLEDDGNHIQSLLLGMVFLVAAIIAFALAVIADLIRTNRTLQEDELERLKRIEYGERKL